MWLLKGSIDFLSKRMNLPYNHLMQDRDIEVGTQDRLDKFLNFYFENHNILSKADRRLLIALVFSSINDAISTGNVDSYAVDKVLNHIFLYYVDEIQDIVYYRSQGDDGDKFLIYESLSKYKKNI